MATHFVIPDTQVSPGVPIDHLYWIGCYIVDRKPDVVVHLGDHADMKSLCSYDFGKLDFEGRRYKKDIDSANRAFTVLNKPLREYNDTRRRYKEKQWWPDRHIALGNHEERIMRAVQQDAKLETLISYDDLNYAKHGWTVHDFKQPFVLDGIAYCHYFYNGMTGRPFGGTAHTKLKNVGHSFVQGHCQGLDVANRQLPTGHRQRAVVAGSCYLHEETYLGPQASNEWRGVLVLFEVQDGDFCLMEVSLDFLCKKYTGKPLEKYKPKVFA